MEEHSMSKKVLLLLSFITLVALTISPFGSLKSQAASTTDAGQPVVRYAERFDGITRLLDIPPHDPFWADLIVLPRKMLPNRPGTPGTPAPDPVWQDTAPVVGTGTTLLHFEGINNVNGVLPPDTNGDVGPNHYVQIVNLSFAIWDKNGNKLYGPANTNTLFAGLGGACETTNDGDPIVLYDHLANRWLISQFALPYYPRGPFYECIAISQTPDPTQGWYRYAFQTSTKKMNDYPHFGVWSDGYYMSMNQFQLGQWAGQGAVVFERDKMLLGQPARMVYFDLYSTDSNLGGMQPSDLDGPAPSFGTPNYFVEIDDDAWGYSPDQLQIWQLKVDWTTTTNSKFTKVGALPVAAFESNMCGGSRNCIPQPGGVNVDAISDRLMYRMQYRNFSTYQTLVLNHTVDVDGSDHAGVRWYELRNTGSGWTIYQQGTYAPNADHRWMGSVAMNNKGEIGLGYSISSSSVYPSIYYSGRLPGDPLGQMTQGESVIINGAGYQNHSSGRWGDYSSLSVDPSDDCTFWYTQEYYAIPGGGSNGAAWQTHIGSFRLTTCDSQPPVDNPPTITVTNPVEDATVTGTVTVTANASDDNGVSQVEFFVDAVSLGVDTNSADGWSVIWNSTQSVDGTHVIKAIATDTIGQTSQDSNNVNVVNAVSIQIHVGDLDGSKSGTNRWNATVTIYVHGADHNPVAGVTVTGNWSAGATGTSSCTTDSLGKCSVTKSTIPNRTTSVTFSVTNLTKTGYTYDSSINHDPDGDSTGTAITVKKQ
jgi:hypothetical protein